MFFVFLYRVRVLNFRSAEEVEDDDEYGKSETDSDEVAHRKGVRRSTRARVTRYDKDFSKSAIFF